VSEAAIPGTAILILPGSTPLIPFADDRVSTMPTWTTYAADGEVDIRMESAGPASWKPRTVFQVLEETVNKHQTHPALLYKKIPQVSGSMTYGITVPFRGGPRTQHAGP
jgi:hypothetical protein